MLNAREIPESDSSGRVAWQISLDFDGSIFAWAAKKEKSKEPAGTPALREATALRLGGEVEIAEQTLFGG